MIKLIIDAMRERRDKDFERQTKQWSEAVEQLAKQYSKAVKRAAQKGTPRK